MKLTVYYKTLTNLDKHSLDKGGSVTHIHSKPRVDNSVSVTVTRRVGTVTV